MKHVVLLLSACLLLANEIAFANPTDTVPKQVETYLRNTLTLMMNDQGFPPSGWDDGSWWEEIFVGTAYRIIEIKEDPTEDPTTSDFRCFTARVEYDLVEVHHRQSRVSQNGCTIEPLNHKATHQYFLRYKKSEKDFYWDSMSANPVYLPGKGIDHYCPTNAPRTAAHKPPVVREPARKRK